MGNFGTCQEEAQTIANIIAKIGEYPTAIGDDLQLANATEKIFLVCQKI